MSSVLISSDINNNNNNNATHALHKAKKPSGKINKLTEQNENANENNSALESNNQTQLQTPPGTASTTLVTLTNSLSTNSIKSLTSSPLLQSHAANSTKSSSSNKIRHISQLESQKAKNVQMTGAQSTCQHLHGQNKNVNQYLSSIIPNSHSNQQQQQQQTQSQPQQRHVSSALGNKSYLVKSSRSNSIDQLIAAAAVTGLSPNSNSSSAESSQASSGIGSSHLASPSSSSSLTSSSSKIAESELNLKGMFNVKNISCVTRSQIKCEHFWVKVEFLTFLGLF